MRGIPHLMIRRHEAEKLLQLQMRRGEAIESAEMSEEAINRAVEQMDAWDLETQDVLASMFDTGEFMLRFADAGTYPNNRGNTREKVMCLGRITYKNYCLSDIIKELPNLPEDVSIDVAEEAQLDFWALIHPGIVAVTKSRFESGHYGDAAETALKHINRYVKEIVKKATGNEYDGADLMRRAFSVNNPIIAIDDLSTENGRSIQQGYMEMFVGAIIGVRNPKVHDVIEISRERGIHFLFFASLLMDTIDMAHGKYRHAV